MADLFVKLGIDISEMEKGLKEAGSKAKDLLENGAKGGLSGGIMSIAGGGIGGLTTWLSGTLFGPIGAAISELIQSVMGKVKEMMDYAVHLRSLKLATGLNYSELQGLEMVAEATGVSLSDLAHTMSEFNKRAGEARQKGGEFLSVITRMGFGLKDLSDGTFNSTVAMKKLAEAHKAGTDAATLAYYGNQLFGSSFERLLPLIKQGTRAIEVYENSIYKSSQFSIDAMSRLGDEWSSFWASFKNIMMDALGAVVAWVQWQSDFIKGIAVRAIAIVSPKMAAERLVKNSLGKTDEMVKQEALSIVQTSPTMSEKDKKEFMDTISNLLNENGKKLSPLGLMTADAASSMQQMGGGDIFGAVAFSPLQSIERNTERTANATEKMASPGNPHDETKPKTFMSIIGL